MDEDIIKIYKDRLRIFLILYFFSEEYTDPLNPTYKKLFTGETKIQKIDFWLRNPDYFSHELLKIAQNDTSKKSEIKDIIKNIFDNKEPIIRREEMEKFRFGAYQDIDNVIAFLDGIELIKFSSKSATDLTVRDKKYYITELAIHKIENNITSLPFLTWYVDRCQLIKKYFGDKSGTQLKNQQYELDQYRYTVSGTHFENIFSLVNQEFYNLYNEQL